jgi:MoxR-like ATPase
MHLAKSYALLNSRDYVTPADVKTVAGPALDHRIILNPGSLVKGIKPQEIIKDILEKIPVPIEV